MADVLNFPLLINAINNEIETILHNRQLRQTRNASDPMNLPNELFRKIYRFNKDTYRYLLNKINPLLPDVEREGLSIPKHLVVLCALHFYAQGSYQKGIGQDFNSPMSQPSVSRCIELVTDILVDHFGNKIRFPSIEVERDAEKAKFFNELNGFPGIIGVIDGTHICIQAPPVDDEDFPAILFYNRKGYYSINAQIICGADYKILGVNPRYPGSVHDSGIWATSVIRNHLLQNYNNGDRASWLIGDSGYPLEPWLITPFIGENLNESERQFNITLKRVRNIVERVIGILKTRFRCCFSHRTLHYGPVKAAKIISACCILHNILIEQRDFLGDDQPANEDDFNEPANRLEAGRNYLNQGRMTRDRIVRTYF